MEAAGNLFEIRRPATSTTCQSPSRVLVRGTAPDSTADEHCRDDDQRPTPSVTGTL